MNAKNGMRAVHPGEILRGELNELGLSAKALSKALGVPVNRVTMILERPAQCERGHGTSAGAVFRDDAATLDEPAEDLGASPGQDRNGPRVCPARDTPAVSGVGKRLPMTVPDFQSLRLPVLKALSAGNDVKAAEVCARVAATEGLTPNDL